MTPARPTESWGDKGEDEEELVDSLKTIRDLASQVGNKATEAEKALARMLAHPHPDSHE